jgi:hypothetical protein
VIAGRSPNLILGFLTAAFNALVVFHVGGFAPTLEQITIVNVFLGALVALVANVPELAIHAGVAAITQMNRAAPGAATPGTDLANRAINGDGIKVIPVPPAPDDAATPSSPA